MLTALFALIAVAAAAPSGLIDIQKFNGPIKPDSYLIQLKPNFKTASYLSSSRVGGVTHSDWVPEIFNGFAGVFNATQLAKLRASDAVAAIYEDGIFHHQTTQTNAPWGLSRLSSGTTRVSGSVTALTYPYTYPTNATGAGVDIYVVDTGILLTHSEFGGRAKWGWSGSGLGTTDDHGHGTHVAGTAAGARYGVAKGATLIAVKVLDASGSGTLANVVGGFNYVQTAARASGRPSIASASLGGGASTAIDSAVASLVSSGVHVVVAAGNSNTDAGSTSPARVPTAFTVGAIDINDTKASYSNFGSVVDIWAPGTSVISSYIGSTSATASLSGTSMATPHVSGAAAVYLSLVGPLAPATLIAQLPSVYGVLVNVTPNRLVQVPVAA